MGPWSLGLAQSCWQCPVIDPSENNIACSQAHLGPSCPLLPPYWFLSFYSVSPEALSCQIYLWHISDIWRLNSKVQELTLPLGTRGWNWYFHTIDNEASIQEQLPPIPTARWGSLSSLLYYTVISQRTAEYHIAWEYHIAASFPTHNQAPQGRGPLVSPTSLR